MPSGIGSDGSASWLRASAEQAVVAMLLALLRHDSVRASLPQLASDPEALADLYQALVSLVIRRLLSLAPATTVAGARLRHDDVSKTYEALLGLRPRLTPRGQALLAPPPAPLSAPSGLPASPLSPAPSRPPAALPAPSRPPATLPAPSRPQVASPAPRLASGRLLKLVPASIHERKRSGSYYSPPALVAFLLDAALDPLLDRACAAPDPEAALLSLAVCDPACGSGHLLLAAARRIALRLARVRAGREPDEAARQQALGEVIAGCLHGVDIDPVAVALCRAALLAEISPAALPSAGARSKPTSPGLAGSPDPTSPLAHQPASSPEPAIHQGDGLFFPWRDSFPQVFARGGFDCVLGNPPFLNSIEGRVSARTKSLARAAHPDFRGTADLAYLFLDAALRLVSPAGRVGMIQPRGLLAARSAERFRARPPGGFRPVALWLPRRPDLFPGASVFVALLVFAAGDPTCAVCVSDDPSLTSRWRRGELLSSNWWSEVQRLLGPGDSPAAPPSAGGAVGERFVVKASMTTADAYDAVPFLVDRPEGDLPRLVTTGLIDPGLCRWGQAVCRYLKRDYQHPRIQPGPGLSKSLARRVAEARRPKLLVAGLSRVIECFVDRTGEHLGAVSTYSIFHPDDDLAALEALCVHLLSPAVTTLFQSTLGASALSGGNTTVRKEFLQTLPLPAALALPPVE